jgi:hypothetical protein
MIIYKTTNLINGKIYIGQDSKNNNNYYGSGKLIKLAIKKYGKENFKKDILENNILNKTILDEREKGWIKYYNSISPNGYNITKGGEGIGDLLKGIPKTKEHNKKNSESLKKLFKEGKLSNKGKNNPNYGKGDKIRGDNNHMRKYSESRKKISKALMGHIGYFKGKKFSKEHRKNISNAKKKLICINKNDKEKYIKKNELKEYIDQGWRRGHSLLANFKNSLSNSGKNNHMYGKHHSEKTIARLKIKNKNRRWIYKDNIDMIIKIEELDYYIKMGWKRGRGNYRGLTAWNKGLTKEQMKEYKKYKK